MVTKFSG